MSDARKCDRCGAYYEPSGRTRIVKAFYSSGLNEAKGGGDLCEGCSGKLEKWWSKPKRKAAR